jgi:hypothetical protein
MAAVTLVAPGVFLGDEVTQSSDPPRHADGVVETCLREGLRWCALQIAPGNERAAELLREACARRGAAFGTWAQGLPAADELAAVRAYGSTFHIANVETPHEDAAWTDAALDELVAMKLPHGLAVIFTQGAWERDRAKSQRWRDRGFVAIPEAIRSENPQATVPAMLELAAALGWPGERTAPCCYLTRGFAAASYAGEIGMAAGRWSLFRYGDVDAADWEAIRAWPKAAPQQQQQQQPQQQAGEKAKKVAASTASATAMRNAVVAAVEKWNPSPPSGSRGAIIRRVAKANDATWRLVGPQLTAILDAAEAPQPGEGGTATPAPPAPPAS